jgi:hypothetical protein
VGAVHAPKRWFGLGIVLLLLLVMVAQTVSAQTSGGPLDEDKAVAETAAAERAAEEARQDEAQAEMEQMEAESGRELDEQFELDYLQRAPTTDSAVEIAAVYGPPGEDLGFTPVTPCRIVDTRLSTAGRIAANTNRSFLVAGAEGFPTQGGKSGGCGIPFGHASAVELNFIVVNPLGTCYIRAAAYPGPIPNASIVHYSKTVPLKSSNGIAVPICRPDLASCSDDLLVRAVTAATDLVIDVVGYYAPPPIPSTTVVNAWATTYLPDEGNCVAYDDAAITVVAPVAGTVTIRANAWMTYFHASGTATQAWVGIGGSPTDCTSGLGYRSTHSIPSTWPSGVSEITIPTFRQVTVGPGVHTFYLTGQKVSGATSSIRFWYAGMEATFEPG